MMEGKNVLYICDYAAAYAGNFIASMTALAEKVQDNNQVYFLLPAAASQYPWAQTLPVDKSHIIWCDFTFRSLFSECRKLSGHLGRNDTVVHTHFVADFFLLAVRMSFSNVICHYHMTVPVCYNFSKKVKRLVRRIIYRGVILIGVSAAVTEDLKYYFWKPACECISNAIDFGSLDKYSEGTDVPEQLRETGKFRILMHGTDFYRKAVDLAAAAVAELNEEYNDSFSLLVTSHDMEEAQRLIETHVGKRMDIRAMRPVANIKKAYDSVELFISPSRAEAFGYAVVESAYARCQVAASDVPGQDTMKTVPGILWFEKDDVGGLKNAILQAKENADAGLVPGIKKEQREFAVREFRIEKWVDQNLAVYSKYFGK